MLSKVTATVKRAFGDRIKQIHLWSDFSIVLHQIRTSPNLLKTYVANRVAKIQDLSKSADWHHVPSSDNPADLLTRGSTVSEWKSNSLWWHGSRWIMDENEWPKQAPLTQRPEQLEIKKTVAVIQAPSENNFLRRYSTYDKLLSITAYCLRFKKNCKQSSKRVTGPLTVSELNQAEITILKLVQSEAFTAEISAIVRSPEVVS